MRARFWIWENDGWIKLTLAPGQALKWRKYTHDEEGYSLIFVRWIHEGNHIRRESGMRGSDCDGAIARGGADHCHLSRLQAVPPYMPGRDEWKPEGRPDWQEVEESWQSDPQAELAGY